jgi:hypothetical protein
MESSMVNEEEMLLDPEKCIYLVLNFFSVKLSTFKLSKKGYYTGYWWVEYQDRKEDMVIYFDGDISGHFHVDITISNTKYSLWQYDRKVNQLTRSSKSNIDSQLEILKSFLKSINEKTI